MYSVYEVFSVDFCVCLCLWWFGRQSIKGYVQFLALFRNTVYTVVGRIPTFKSEAL